MRIISRSDQIRLIRFEMIKWSVKVSTGAVILSLTWWPSWSLDLFGFPNRLKHEDWNIIRVSTCCCRFQFHHLHVPSLFVGSLYKRVKADNDNDCMFTALFLLPLKKIFAERLLPIPAAAVGLRFLFLVQRVTGRRLQWKLFNMDAIKGSANY